MQFKASTDYGLRAVLYLAAQGHTCSSKDIAQDMSIPRDYLIQLAQLLRNAGIIEARPGKHGGYRLANAPIWSIRRSTRYSWNCSCKW